MIPKETVERIIDTARIEEVVGDFVALKRRGANYIACCPFHNEKTPSFSVSPAKGIYKCFGCGKSGTAVGFVMEHENMSYVEALKYLGAKYHIEVVEKEESAEDIAKKQHGESLMLVSDFAWKFFISQLDTPQGKAVGYQYFKSRGLEDATIERFGLGWAPVGKDLLVKKAREAGFKEEFLTETGLAVKRDDGTLVDRFYDRVVFPIHSVSGRVVAFGCRTLRSDKTVAKYVNSPESEIYIKSRTLYALHLAKNEIARQDRCILVEGYLDVISMHQLGITNVVASCGTSLTVEQVRLIHKFTDNIDIIYDGDSAGIHASLRAIKLVLEDGMNPHIVLLPDDDDPDSYSRKHTLEEVRDFISTHEQDFVDFMVDNILAGSKDPLKMAEFINELADTIALIPDPVKRSVYVESCAERFNVASTILFERIRQKRQERIEAERKRQEREENLQGAAREGSMPAREDVPQTAVPDSGESASQKVVLNDPYLAPCEKEILSFVLNNGDELLEFDVDSDMYSEEPVTVADFIDSALDADKEDFVNEIYYRVYEEYFTLLDEGLDHSQIQQRLMNGQDRDIAQVATELIIPKYTLTVSNYQNSMTALQTTLVTYVPRAILVYKVKRLEKQMRECSLELKTAGPEEITGILERLKQLQSINNVLNKRLGRGFEKK